MRETSAWHEVALPWQSAPSFFETVMAPAVAAAFRDPRGRPSVESPTILAAHLGPDLAGYVMLSATPEPRATGPIVVVDIWTAPAFRRRGVG